VTRAKRENIDGFRVFIVDMNLILCFDRFENISHNFEEWAASIPGWSDRRA
jgi:hypothetical protein